MCGNNVFLKENQKLAQYNRDKNQGIYVKNEILNLDYYFKSFAMSHPSHLVVTTFTNVLGFTTFTCSKQWTNSILAIPRSIGVRRNWRLVYMQVIETINKNNKVLVDAMD